MRERVPATAVLFVSLSALASGVDTHGVLQRRLQEAIWAFPGVMGIAVKNLDTGETLYVSGDMRFPTASLIKVAAMVERPIYDAFRGAPLPPKTASSN